MKEVGKRLRALRESLSLSQAKLAELLADHPVQSQPIRKRAVNANGRSVPQVCGLL